MPTTKLGLPTVTGNMAADVPKVVNELANAVDGKLGVAGGFAKHDDLSAHVKVKTGRTILAANWLLDATTQLYKYDLTDSDITASTVVDVNIRVNDLEKAADLKSANESFNGYVRLYAESPPAENITCDLKLIRQVF